MKIISVTTKKTIHDSGVDPDISYSIEEGGELLLVMDIQKGFTTARNRQIHLTAEGVSARVIGVYEGRSVESLLITVDTIHHAPNTTARTEFRAVLSDQSRFEFHGRIKILPGAHGSQDFLQQDTLLLSDEARAVTIPGLEIEADDVKASHGATAKPISPAERFYLMSRGLTKDESERMIVDGFLAPVRAYQQRS
jgi:Fe-S cluster assembly scaffold protein SufB